MTTTGPKPLCVAVVGAGEWGKNHVRMFAQLKDARLVTVCDLDEPRLADVRASYPDVRVTTRYEDVVRDSAVEGVVIASFAAQHYDQARRAFEAGKHVLVEKPMTLAPGEAEALVRVARQSGRCLMVGRPLLYHPAVVKMKHLVTSGDVGEPFYLYSQRLNLGRVRNDENALWSFGPHDVAVAVHLFDAEPEVVTAKGEAYLQPGIVDVVFVTLHFPQRKMAHIHLSWLDPHKTRRSEEHTSELQSQSNLVCRLLLEKKKKNKYRRDTPLRITHTDETSTPAASPPGRQSSADNTDGPTLSQLRPSMDQIPITGPSQCD